MRQRLQGELREIKPTMIAAADSVALEAGNKAVAEGDEQYVISGERNLFSVQELAQDMTRLRRLFDLFEQQDSLIQHPRPVAARRRACRSSSAASRARRSTT